MAKIRVIKKKDEYSLEYQVGDVLEVQGTWYGGVHVAGRTGIPVSLDREEYVEAEESPKQEAVSGQRTKERKMKRMEDSLTEQSHLLMPRHLNAAGYLFGGQLLAWIDETAGIVAKRHAEMNVVTVAVDNMYFKAGARVDDTIVLIGRVTHVGRSSMEVRIDTYCENLEGMRTMINRAYFVMVGTDDQQHPVEVPGLLVEGVTQQIEWDAGQKRSELRKLRREEGF